MMHAMTQPTGSQEPPPAPGWYDVSGEMRYWNGAEWVSPVQTPRPAGNPPPAQPSVTYMPVQTNHTFHLLMSLITCGAWAVFVWFPMTVWNQLRKRKVVTRPY